MQPKIEFNKQCKQTLDLMENTKEHVLLTGRAGTGKSTLLHHFISTTRKNAVVLAPTGVAALNVRGQTIHSFFHFRIGITPDSVRAAAPAHRALYKKLDTIIIDEISMVRADLLDCIDRFLRKNGPHQNMAFGGVQMIFVGDMFQLPPVVTPNEKALLENNYAGPYFFYAHVFKKGLSINCVELTQIYRQNDSSFIELLNMIREGAQTNEHLALLNKRYNPRFNEDKNETHLHLVTTNIKADQINERKLAKLHGKTFTAKASSTGDWGENSQGRFPTNETLYLKEGAQVMLLNNDQEKRWVNGDMAKIVRINDHFITVKLENGKVLDVKKYVWESVRYFYDDLNEKISSDVVATFTQYPLRLAWAVTIHKAQGKTFDNVVIDFGTGTFAHGQAYVAISRCRTLGGVILRRPIRHADIIVDRAIVDFAKNKDALGSLTELDPTSITYQISF